MVESLFFEFTLKSAIQYNLNQAVSNFPSVCLISDTVVLVVRVHHISDLTRGCIKFSSF